MSRASALLAALSKAAPEKAPCWKDKRFIQDLPAGRSLRRSADIAALKAVCDKCPLLDLCEQTAEAVNATSGFWAGRSWSRATLYAGDSAALDG